MRIAEPDVKISIAMCTYNGVRFLQDQLASLAAQQRLPDEVVVCDDCSTDESLDVLKRFAAKAPFPIKIHENETRLGSTKNFEQAIGLCQGEVIALCDQDDIWDPRKLSLIEQCFNENRDVAMLFSDAEIVDEQAKSLGFSLWESLRLDNRLQARIKTTDAFELLTHRPLVTGATMAFRATFKDLVLPIPSDIPLIHDGWIALIISLAGKLDLLDLPLVKYRQHEEQQIGARDNTPPPQPAGILAKAQHHYSFGPQIKMLEAVRERARSTNDRYVFTQQVNLDQKLKHLHSRAKISQQRLARIPVAFGELISGRYHRYSNGFYSLMKDLVQ